MAVTLQTLAIPGIFISYSLPPPLDGSYMFQKEKILLSLFCFSFFVYVFGGLECVGHSFAYVPFLCFFQRCLDSNPESCHPPNLAIHFCLSFSGTWKDHNFSFPEDKSIFFETLTDPRLLDIYFFFGTWTYPMLLNRAVLSEIVKIVFLDRSFSSETRKIEFFFLPRDRCLFLEQRTILIHFP
jgi:hypothetical protein